MSLLQESLEVAKFHLNRAKINYEQLKNFSDRELLDPKNFNTNDAFILRFIKLQDLMGTKIFKLVLDELGEYRGDMSMLDMLDKLEKLNLIPSADQWMDFRKKRNELTHEYPQNEKNILEGFKLALEQFPQVEEILFNIEKRFK